MKTFDEINDSLPPETLADLAREREAAKDYPNAMYWYEKARMVCGGHKRAARYEAKRQEMENKIRG